MSTKHLQQSMTKSYREQQKSETTIFPNESTPAHALHVNELYTNQLIVAMLKKVLISGDFINMNFKLN